MASFGIDSKLDPSTATPEEIKAEADHIARQILMKPAIFSSGFMLILIVAAIYLLKK